MADMVKTMKLHINVKESDVPALKELTSVYSDACNFVSHYIFTHSFILNSVTLSNSLYQTIRQEYGLKSQFTQSAIRTVTARYKTVKEQLFQNPYKYKDEDGSRKYVTRTLEWLWKPLQFRRPQSDLVRGRDYSFVDNGEKLSLNTLQGRIRVSYDAPECFREYFDGTWSFGTGKLVSLMGEWYFHIPMSKAAEKEYCNSSAKHVVGIDRGLRFFAAVYDEKGETTFFNGKEILRKRDPFDKVRAELQSKGTKSAKRVLKRISGRENRWMSDVNHQISKTLCDMYGSDTLFVLEDLTDVSFAKENLSRSKKQRHDLRSWPFYQLEQFLKYKAEANGSMVINVPADYTSQRCPKCGRIHKGNRRHDTHEYVCDRCGYRSNDDRIGAMNLQELGTLYISGDTNPRFGARKTT